MENEIALTKTQIDRLKHTIGWNYDNQPRKHGRSKPILNAYRNHYYNENDETCEELCKAELMNKRHTTSPHDNLPYYYVTPYGFEVLEQFFDIKIKRED